MIHNHPRSLKFSKLVVIHGCESDHVVFVIECHKFNRRLGLPQCLYTSEEIIEAIDEAECWAAYKGLELAWNSGYKKMVLEIDSEKVVKWELNRAADFLASEALKYNRGYMTVWAPPTGIQEIMEDDMMGVGSLRKIRVANCD
ncbi:uncharacterized protein [Primulina eburnea]|uniref:uncharacterized protein n=1 Tax=Primulina eburnea TaxID=1245227 RepID=UPI003C6C004E